VPVWQSGLLDELQPEIMHCILACAHDDDGWAILMHDVSNGLLPWDRYINPRANEDYLRSLAHLHAHFWNSPTLEQPELGLCSMAELTAMSTPGHGGPSLFEKGFSVIPQVYAPDVAEILCELVSNPQPLFRVLACYPHTLVHGDYKVTNLAWNVSPQLPVVALDWQLAAIGSPTMELAWYASYPNFSPAPPAQCIDLYHQYLARELGSRWDESYWQPLLELGLLTNMVRKCVSFAYYALYDDDKARQENVRKSVPMCSDWVRPAVVLCGSM
jgi:hypothetical protein